MKSCHNEWFSLLVIVAICVFGNLNTEGQQLVQDCEGSISNYPEERLLNCKYWIIKVYEKPIAPNPPRTWGAITGKTREEVTSQLARDQVLAQKVFHGAGQTYELTSEPICNLCGADNANDTPSSSIIREINEFISKYHNEIEAYQLGKKLNGLYKSYTTKTKPNPYSGAGSLVTTYLDNVADALETQRKLELVLDHLVGLSGANLQLAERYFENEFERDYVARVRQVNASFNSLPDSIKRELSENGATATNSSSPGQQETRTQQNRKVPCCGYWAAVWLGDLRIDPHPYRVSNVFRSAPCWHPGNDNYNVLTYVNSVIGPSPRDGAFSLRCKPTRNEMEQEIKAPPSYRLVSTWSIPDDPNVSP